MSDIIHLNSYEDREESAAYCTRQFEYPNTNRAAEATCIDCLEMAQAAAELEAARCKVRLADLKFEAERAKAMAQAEEAVKADRYHRFGTEP